MWRTVVSLLWFERWIWVGQDQILFKNVEIWEHFISLSSWIYLTEKLSSSWHKVRGLFHQYLFFCFSSRNRVELWQFPYYTTLKVNGQIVNLDRILQYCKICIVGLISRDYGVQNGSGVTDLRNFENVFKIKFREICC